jgi:hypothetical protein
MNKEGSRNGYRNEVGVVVLINEQNKERINE